ncbi:MAG TPA: LysM peptidoglycan-binding domain-containing protein [Burkholderiales bacterium]|nr:LysM peptidoglycan-binding domain-containing protein [Burkholderiales bacterium]
MVPNRAGADAKGMGPERWKWGPKMGKSIISLLLAATWTCGALADEIKLAENAPDRYVVVKGDTLWGISGKFLKDPWRWPDIWGLNKEEIKNPHWIYPGDVLVLDFTGKTPHLRRAGEGGGAGGSESSDGEWRLMDAKLSPTIRKSTLASAAISSIPASAIQPFLGKPLVVGDHELEAAPTLVAGPETRVVLSAGDSAFAKGVVWEENNGWSVFRPGRVLVDPDTKETLGREAVYLGEGQVTEFGEVSTVLLTHAVQEIVPGDRLAKVAAPQTMAYVPHAPASQIRGRVIAGPGDSVSEIASKQVVIINRGSREGMEIGHVLALYHDRPPVTPANAASSKEKIKLPPERYGMVFVFRVFEKVSYGLVLNSTQPANVLDVVQNP